MNKLFLISIFFVFGVNGSLPQLFLGQSVGEFYQTRLPFCATAIGIAAQAVAGSDPIDGCLAHATGLLLMFMTQQEIDQLIRIGSGNGLRVTRNAQINNRRHLLFWYGWGTVITALIQQLRR